MQPAHISWKVTYDNGDSFWHYNDERQTEKHISYEQIDRERLRSFALYIDDQLKFVLDFTKGDGHKLVYLRRGLIIPGLGEKSVYILAKKGQFVGVLYPDGGFVIMDNFSEEVAHLNAPNMENHGGAL